MIIYKIILISIFLTSSLFAKGYPKPKSFSYAVKIFKKIDFDYTRTAYTNELYAYDPMTCMDKFYLKDDPETAVVFARIVPQETVGKTRTCWDKNSCTSYVGRAYGGELCCRLKDRLYQSYDRDLFNIMPVVEKRRGEFTVPPEHMKGNIARVYFYMNAQYGLNLSFEEQMRYFKWHAMDPADEKECHIHEEIQKVQGRSNPWIKSSCDTLESRSSKSSQE